MLSSKRVRLMMMSSMSSMALGSTPVNGSSSRMNLGLDGERAGDLHAPPLPAGERPRHLMPLLGDVQLLHQLIGALLALLPGKRCICSTR